MTHNTTAVMCGNFSYEVLNGFKQLIIDKPIQNEKVLEFINEKDVDKHVVLYDMDFIDHKIFKQLIYFGKCKRTSFIFKYKSGISPAIRANIDYFLIDGIRTVDIFSHNGQVLALKQIENVCE